ncbi:SDR family NAD(P)-dependent oxidoreductase [Roseicyclus sp.]|uniref:SDR family NAD(P)-dependent oxidoreductase n=1 Tax=Roseicyclus sp. TaxID=1914329 RepID=UPI003FA092C0
MRRFEGRRVLLAGGGSIGPGVGNGKAAAILYAREGAEVFVIDRNPDAAAETAARIEAEGGKALAHTADLTRPDEVNGAVARMLSGGGIDVLHYNLGTSVKGGVVDTLPEDWARVFDVNLNAAYHLSRAVLPIMEAEGKGALVYVSSLAGLRSGPYSYVAYEASKAALQRMAQSIARAYAEKGIRANVVLPGPIDTPHVTAIVAPDADPEALAAARARLVPMGRQGTPWEVAEAAMFLASDAASFVTGVLLPVDGGMSL